MSLGRRATFGAATALLLARRAVAASPPSPSPTPTAPTNVHPTMQWEFDMRITWASGRNPTGVYSAGQRIFNTVSGGDFAGPLLRGTVLPGGGDWALMNPPEARLDKAVDGREIAFDARYILRTDDGVHLYVTNHGGKFTGHDPGTPASADADRHFAVSAPFFDVPLGSRYDFLTHHVYVALSEARPAETVLHVYRVIA